MNSYDCNQDSMCKGVYNVAYDIAFWFISCLMPFVIGTVTANYFTSTCYTEYLDIISTSINFIYILIGVGARYYVIDQFTQFVQPTLIMNVLTAIAFYGMRVRFIFTFLSTSMISFIWIIMNIPWLYLNPQYKSSGRSFYIGSVCTIAIGLLTSLATYETEYFYRMQFLMAKEMKKNNTKLTNQLKLLAKSYNMQAGSLESPLERSVMVIRSVMADPVLSSQHLMALGQVLALLSSSNLLAPDLEGNFADGLDNQQQAWLFSEIAAKKRRGGPRKIKSRRKSILQNPIETSGSKIEVYAESTADDKLAVSEINSRPSVNVSSILNKGEHHVSHKLINSPLKQNDKFNSTTIDEPGAEYPPVNDNVTKLLLKYDDYNWQIFDFSKATRNHPLTVLSHHLFTNANFFECFSIPRDKFRNFLLAIEHGYDSSLPYHNSLHATDVLHCFAYLANLDQICKLSSDIETLAMYLAAIIHGLIEILLIFRSRPPWV